MVAVGDVVVTDPLRSQKSVQRLSVREWMVLSRTSKHCAAASLWKKAPMSSSCELLMGPVGLLVDAKELRTWAGKGTRQMIGPVSVCRRR